MSDTPLTDAAISQRRYYERRGEWHGDDVFLYVEPGDARAIEQELREEIAVLREALRRIVLLADLNPFEPVGHVVEHAAPNARELISEEESRHAHVPNHA